MLRFLLSTFSFESRSLRIFVVTGVVGTDERVAKGNYEGVGRENENTVSDRNCAQSLA